MLSEYSPGAPVDTVTWLTVLRAVRDAKVLQALAEAISNTQLDHNFIASILLLNPSPFVLWKQCRPVAEGLVRESQGPTPSITWQAIEE